MRMRQWPAHTAKFRPRPPWVGNPTSSLNPTRRVSCFSDSSTNSPGKIFESFLSMASRVTPGVLEQSHHIQTLKKLGFSKPPTSTSSSARTRRASGRVQHESFGPGLAAAPTTKVDPWPIAASASPPGCRPNSP